MSTASIDWLGLSFAPGIGSAGFWRLTSRFGSPTAVLETPAGALRGVAGMRRDQCEGLARADELRRRAEMEVARLAEMGAAALTFADDAYPDMLRHLAAPPPVLYVRGRAELLAAGLCVAIVGSRAATVYGRRTAYAFGGDFARKRVCVVSGLALGIDSEAHAGCLAAGGDTVAVLGCGLDVVYPRTNEGLFRQIASRGLLVSEYPLGTRPEGFRFPARNRIIAGLSRAVVVVEASKKSGSLITVQHALENGREVFAVPGRIDSFKSAGTHWLLQQGAALAVCGDDVVAQVRSADGADTSDAGGTSTPGRLDAAGAELLALMEPYSMRRQELLQRSGVSPARLSELLLMLELAGYIEVLPGDQVRRIEAP